MSSNRLFRTLALVGALALGSLAPVAKADVLGNITRSGMIKIAVPQDFPPFGSVGADMKPSGYDIDVANLIGKELGTKVELVPVSSANRVPFLTTGKVDLVISSMGKNAEREKVIDFSTAYAPFFNGVFGPEDIKAAKADELAGKTISVTRGSIEDLELSKIAPASAVIKRFEDNNATITAFSFDILANLVYLAAVASVLGYGLWNLAIERIGAVRTSNYIYLMPLFTMLAGVIVLDEHITPLMLAGGGLILLGVYVNESSRFRLVSV